MDYRGLSRGRESSKKSTAIVQARQHGGLDKGSGTGDGEKWYVQDIFRRKSYLDLLIVWM